ncbi:cyclopropane-fatty-acyl-phospholipid synthase [Candidatus Vecturithrix granuli]|uniref:Cyclopropane-fatty-acyl-phospholipid synthase n=1 Tax=Vecturithrix granuli TaxID=1499967 RepID=A0A081BW26_VECG1|nr:cyclopropane-fatty-acyl-phospholipid synthase [Candidatus Vecturithrix granuli]
MTTKTIIPKTTRVVAAEKLGYLDKLAREMLFSLLRKLKRGQLVLEDGGEQFTFGECSDDFPLRAVIRIQHPRCYSQIVFGGSVGAGRAYIEGSWTTEDLTAVVRMIILNQDVMVSMDQGWSTWLMTPLYKVFHLLNKNTREGSQSNILAHYDLGNEFYELFLDETMTYSCGIFETPESTLKDASIAKYDRICQKLQLGPEDRVLEIGTGWGGFALHAAQKYGCRITTTTISRKQHAFAKERITRAGLTDRIELLMQDYRDLRGQYDKLVSIEMIEAVGHQYYDTFLRCCNNLLKENGMMLIQAITIPDHVFDRHKRSVDFIKRYIFPGSCIPSVTALLTSMAKVTDLRLVHLEDITPHYATTLRTWRERFLANIEQVRKSGFPDPFLRMWEFYLCYCEAGFMERYLGDVQLIFTKPLCRRNPILPALKTER